MQPSPSPPFLLAPRGVTPFITTNPGKTSPLPPREEKRAHKKEVRASNEGGEENKLSTHPQPFPINSFTLWGRGSSSAACLGAQWSNSPRMTSLGRLMCNSLVFRQCSPSRQGEGSRRSSWRCSVWCSGGEVQLLLPEILLGFENTPGARWGRALGVRRGCTGGAGQPDGENGFTWAEKGLFARNSSPRDRRC